MMVFLNIFIPVIHGFLHLFPFINPHLHCRCSRQSRRTDFLATHDNTTGCVYADNCALRFIPIKKGNAGALVDTDPNDDGSKLKVMVVGHADKIRMQVRHVTSDGKVYINSDSFLPSTLIGNQVTCFSRKVGEDGGEAVGEYQKINGTVEALGAIHFAPASHRTGTAGVKPKDLYLELGISGEDRKEQVNVTFPFLFIL